MNERTVCRDTSKFNQANAMIYTTAEPEVNEEAHPPPVVSEFEIPGGRTPHNVPPN